MNSKINVESHSFAQSRHTGGALLSVTARQLRKALEFVAPDGTDEQLDQEVLLQRFTAGINKDGQAFPGGLHVWTDEPDGGSILLSE